MYPAAVVEGSKAPGFIGDPTPSPRRDPGPVPVPVGRPVRCDSARVPDGPILGVLRPAAIGVEVLGAGHFGRNIAGVGGGHRSPVTCGAPLGEIVIDGRRQTVARLVTALSGLPELRALPGTDFEAAVFRLEMQRAVVRGGAGTVGIRVKAVDTCIVCVEPTVWCVQFEFACDIARRQFGDCPAPAQVEAYLFIVDPREIQRRVRIEANGHRADLDFGLGAGPGGQDIATGQRVVQRCAVRFAGTRVVQADRAGT